MQRLDDAVRRELRVKLRARTWTARGALSLAFPSARGTSSCWAPAQHRRRRPPGGARVPRTAQEPLSPAAARAALAGPGHRRWRRTASPSKAAAGPSTGRAPSPTRTLPHAETIYAGIARAAVTAAHGAAGGIERQRASSIRARTWPSWCSARTRTPSTQVTCRRSSTARRTSAISAPLRLHACARCAGGRGVTCPGDPSSGSTRSWTPADALRRRVAAGARGRRDRRCAVPQDRRRNGAAAFCTFAASCP